MVIMSDVYMLEAPLCAYQRGLLPEFESTLETTVKSLMPVWRDFGVDTPLESLGPR
jgi:hypothetical protein